MKINKTNKIITLIGFLTLLFFISSLPSLQAQDKKNPEAPKVKQKITTPTLELSEEEEKRVPRENAEEGKTVAPPGEVKFAPKTIRNKTHVELIIDASGSMNGLMGQTTKMALLKSAVNDILTQPLPDGTETEFGIRVYGSQKKSEENDCNDTTLLSPIGKLDKKEIKKQVDSINALGVTPIGNSLKAAAKDFKEQKDIDNVIVLVTDGQDSCKADICQIAKEIHDGSKKIMIHVIGFDLDQQSRTALECVAKNGDGKFLSARDDAELRSALDQVLMANIPYNLRVKVVSGATPLPSTLKVYKARTKKVIREDETSGIQYYQLPPGAYDIEIVYSDSKENPLPSKILKNVAVQSTSKAEQIVQFDLGMIVLSAYDESGAPIGATYMLHKKEDPRVRATAETGPGPYTLWLTDGTYNATVAAKNEEGLKLTAKAENLKIETGKSISQDFQFQVGKFHLTAKNTKGEAVPLAYTINPAAEKDKDKITIEGTTPKEGKVIDLPPGKYNISYKLFIEGMKDFPGGTIEDLQIDGGEHISKEVILPTGILKIVGKDNKGNLLETIFSIKRTGSKEKPIKRTFIDEAIQFMLPPGDYDIHSEFQNTDITPPPSISWENVELTRDQILEREAVFRVGLLKLVGQNSKGAPLLSAFHIYKVGGEKPILSIHDINNLTTIKLTEGFYDIKAEDLTSRSSPKPSVWFHNIQVLDNKPVTETAIFTYGKLKMICRGPNDTLLDCDYKVFTYGMDSPLFEGTTTDVWKEFDIPPGNYYVEAGHHDLEDEVLLKKWITFRVTPNEMVEQVIRF